MSNASIRVRSASEYVIEVNDKGETISFDLMDNSLIIKAMEAFEKIDKLFAEYEGRAESLDDGETDSYLDGEITVPKNLKAGAQLLDEVYAKAREAMDTFLGEGACQKIFGYKNFPDMFDVLTEELKPHFEKMGITVDQIRKKTAEKYLNRKQRRALK